MKKIISVLVVLLLPFSIQAQSESVRELHRNLKLSDGFVSMSVSGGVLRFITRFTDMENAKDIRKAAKDIKSVKVYTFPKKELVFTERDIKNLRAEIKNEAFEELMVVSEGTENVNVLIKEKDGEIINTLFFIEEAQNLVVLDLIGRIDLADIYRLMKDMEKQ
jgi:hypothetical protein